MFGFLKNFGSNSQDIDAKTAYAQLKGENPPLLLDVRSKEEFRDAHIAGAKLIPLDELSRRQAELPKDRPILCICRSGSRSGMAVGQLKAAGFNVTNISGGLISWQMAGLPLKK
jgi:rhodanese-related sulfurtransferase